VGVTAKVHIAFRVPAEIKAQVRELAAREGATESALLKNLLGAVLREPAQSAKPLPPTVSVPKGRLSRLYLRLSCADARLLSERAGARGLAPATYASLLIRVHLHGGAPLPKAEYLALRQAILEVSAIGRNLNQIARALHADGKASGPGRAEVQMMLKIATGLKEHFKALLQANERAWNLGDAEAPR
jgi:Bacterial mobilisation protein (MobC)